MLNLITSDTIANEVSMLRMSMRGPIVLVEGKTDTRVYRRFFLPAPHVRLVYCTGKPTLQEAMSKLRSRRMQSGVLGICDADYDRIANRGCGENIFYADWHDAEMMISHSDAFSRVLEELFDREPPASEVQLVRDDLLRISSKVGAIRIWNEQNKASLKFSGVDIGKHLLGQRQFDMGGYVADLLENSPSAVIEAGFLIDVANAESVLHHDAETGTGHDFCALLAAETRIMRAGEGYAIEPDMVESMLRLSFDSECFAKTELAAHLSRWEELAGLDLLRDEACPVL